jgi:hypothetical protein
MHMLLLFRNGLGMHIHDRLELEIGCTILKYIPKNKQGRGVKHGVFLCRGRSRAVTFLKTSNHDLNRKQSLHDPFPAVPE